MGQFSVEICHLVGQFSMKLNITQAILIFALDRRHKISITHLAFAIRRATNITVTTSSKFAARMMLYR